MSTVTEVRAFRGVARLSFDDAAPLKVRLKHFKAHIFERRTFCIRAGNIIQHLLFLIFIKRAHFLNLAGFQVC